ncbi:helix-turn-helix domain-containing protein [Amycolatopsis sp. NPDC050768]|uniref:TetR/AcrR family transcriptional regulator n=1 Tax=Amycolatopsis sp. NPDC050768 TaxID=3154839 RepID=UPI00340F9C96
MSTNAVHHSPRQHRRADAERSIATILDAAVIILRDRPRASMTEIATAAGVARQTVYTHYPSRAALIHAVEQRALTDVVAAIDAADIDHGSPAAALDRLLTVAWQTGNRHHLPEIPSTQATGEATREQHQPILDRLQQLITRGQDEGAFDPRLPATWLVATFLALAHAAGDEVRANRMNADDALRALRRSLSRVLGVDHLAAAPDPD